MTLTNIEVSKESADRLSRLRWCFSLTSYPRLVLTSYHEETRETTRHKFKGPKWDRSDERYYNSKLPRPTDIPQWVRNEALTIPRWRFAIGWNNEQSEIE